MISKWPPTVTRHAKLCLQGNHNMYSILFLDGTCDQLHFPVWKFHVVEVRPDPETTVSPLISFDM